ncbi:MAG: response regulator [Hoeflea sp.]|uniref:response regulator n=1 Tax=Hoeflea sp. TaxID=1940281 RepID=UPI0032EED6F1
MTTKDPLLILLVDDDPAEFVILERKLADFEGPPVTLEHVGDIDAAVARISGKDVDLVLLDNRLKPTVDFRETAPKLREAGFVGPIGIISSDISDAYISEFLEYGVDFRIGKDEIDANTISFIVAEYIWDTLSETCAEDLQ